MRPSRRAVVTFLSMSAWLAMPTARAEPCLPTPQANTELTDLWIGEAGDLWVVGADGALGHRDAHGGWCWQAPLPGEPWTAVWGSDAHDVRFGSARGAVLRHDAHGFRVEREPDGARISGLWGSGPHDVYAVGTEGHALHFDGEAWHAIDPEPGYQLRAVWGTDAAHVWAVGRIATRTVLPSGSTLSGADLVVLRRTAAGWTREGSFSQLYGGGGLSAIDGTSAHDVWAVGMNQPAGAATSVSIAVHFDGVRWREVPLPDELHTHRVFRDVAAALPGSPYGVLIATSDGALRGAASSALPPGDVARTWTRDLEAPALTGVAQRNGAVWAVGANLTVLRATPTGWSRASVDAR